MSAIAASQDDELIPVEKLQRKLRDFGKAYGFGGANTIARALGLEFNKVNRILHDTRITVITGKTVREIETAIRHFNPRTSDETIVKGDVFARHCTAWLKRHNLRITEGARILELPATTFGNWIRYPKDRRAGDIRPALVAMQEYSIEEAKRLDAIDKYNAKPVDKRGGMMVKEKESV